MLVGCLIFKFFLYSVWYLIDIFIDTGDIAENEWTSSFVVNFTCWWENRDLWSSQQENKMKIEKESQPLPGEQRLHTYIHKCVNTYIFYMYFYIHIQ